MSAAKAFLILHGKQALNEDVRAAVEHQRAQGWELAVRLTWRDEAANDRVTRPEDFEDMAAVQLYKGQPEPFLGMGGVNQGIDLWLWRASWQGRGREPNSLLDEY